MRHERPLVHYKHASSVNVQFRPEADVLKSTGTTLNQLDRIIIFRHQIPYFQPRIINTRMQMHVPDSERAYEVERLYAIAPVGLSYFDTQLRYRYINEWLAKMNGLPM